MATTSAIPFVNSSQQRPGIIIWANTIRTTMANDPGRQTLQDQIQVNGFLFLDDYLENILAGPRRDPMIELVKTPGRKRTASKKARAATTATKAQGPTVSDWELDLDKENRAPSMKSSEDGTPLNSFHKALLLSKKYSSVHIPPRKDGRVHFVNSSTPQRPHAPGADPLQKDTIIVHDDEEENAVELLVSSPPPSKWQDASTSATSETIENLAPVLSDAVAELTVIVEDDEPFEGPNSAQSDLIPVDDVHLHRIESTQTPANDIPLVELVEPVQDMDVDDAVHNGEHHCDTGDGEPGQHSATITPMPTVSAPAAVIASQDLGNSPFPQSQPVPPTTAIVSPSTLVRNKSVPFFPTIGAPSPLRKSMRAPRETVPAVSSSVKLPQLPSRSSWLVKAREAKAVEESSKRIGTSTNNFATLPPEHTAVPKAKRKSGDIVDLEDIRQESERKHKITKISNSLSDATKLVDSHQTGGSDHPRAVFSGIVESPTGTPDMQYIDQVENLNDERGAIASNVLINNLKRTVEDFSARTGKSMSKSLGGNAATVLAEARATAEARIAMRHATENEINVAASSDMGTASIPAFPVGSPEELQDQAATVTASQVERQDIPIASGRRETRDRLSVSDLVSAFEGKSNPKVSPVAQPTANFASASINPDSSTSTTPPQSPPKSSASVFDSVFRVVQTAEPPAKAIIAKRLPLDVPALFPHILDVDDVNSQPQLYGESQSTLVSTQPSMFSDGIFGSRTQTWLSSTQGTQFTDPTPSQTNFFAFNAQAKGVYDKTLNERKAADESWHLDEKFEQTWSADNSATWNTAATVFFDEIAQNEASNAQVPERDGPAGGSEVHSGRSPVEVTNVDAAHHDAAADLPETELELNEDDVEDIAGVENQPASHPTTKPGRATTHSPSVTQNILTTASKLMSSVLGSSKKIKPEPVKSIQLAAVAAKKQQEEQEKKAVRLKDMETRRQQALQRKVDEVKAREEKKLKEEGNRRKREREETTEKRALRQPGKKLTQMEDTLVKKAKGEATVEKKPEAKKVMPKDRKDLPASRIAKPSLIQSQSALSSSVGASKQLKQTIPPMFASTTVKLIPKAADLKLSTLGSSSLGQSMITSKGKAVDGDASDRQPAQVMQAAMQARVQAQLRAEQANQAAPFVSENIELPDINSEYSDSDDEDRVRTFDPPEWAQSPELRNALQTQSTVNPDDIFGAIRPLRMEELFKTRTSRFRARTSSANWAGTDELTIAEERSYAKRMGYTS